MPGKSVVGKSDDTDMTPLDELRDDSLVRRLTAAPSLHATDAARLRVTDWLAQIANSPPGKALRRVWGGEPNLHAPLTGLAGGSGYLWGLVRAPPPRLPWAA